MRAVATRRGSALLIILGMLTFMVVSALAFAIYMRQSRMPTNYLRRSTTARYLLRSALADAIDRIDGTFNTTYERVEGIYDDVYPGLGNANTRVEDNGNYWVKRVFTPFGPSDPTYTVSTLSFEALAYLPPAIINEVRVYSRLTQTAEWRNLSYDTGRYAFCAVDVSDCFDINKVRGDVRRTSAAGERVTLSSLYPDAGMTKIVNAAVTKVKGQGDAPYYVSLADFNRYLGSGSDLAPFMRFVGKSNSEIYNRDDHKAVSNALFITDTWFPPTNRPSSALTFNLEAGGENQPLRTKDFTEDASMLQFAKKNGGGLTRAGTALEANLGFVGMACLFDYLDADNRPVSLVLPTTETVPMLCGLGLVPAALRPTLAMDAAGVRQGTYDSGIPDPEDPKKTLQYFRKAEPYKLNLGEQFQITGTVAYPFKHMSAREEFDKDAFSVEVLVKIFFAPSDMRCRFQAADGLYPSEKGAWANGYKNGIVTVAAKAEKFRDAIPGDCQKQEEAVIRWNAEINLEKVLNGRALPMFWRVREFDKPNDAGTLLADYVSVDGLEGDSQTLRFYAEKGDGNATTLNLLKFSDMGKFAGTETDVGTWPATGGDWGTVKPAAFSANATKYVPHVAVWVRVVNKKGETLDMVPARLADDAVWGGRDIGADIAADLADDNPCFGKGLPMLDFRGGAERAFTFGYSDQAASDAANAKLDGKETFDRWAILLAPDPRFNFAPENWLALKTGKGNFGEVTKQDWLDCVTPALGKNDRDHDIFMFVSDQEYLQSVGELAFLPALEPLNGKSSGLTAGAYPQQVKFNGADMSQRVGVGMDALACGDFMWRTYSAHLDPIYALRDKAGKDCYFISGINDFRVNPYSSDPRVLASVIRNTPYDYYTASTNDQCGLVKVSLTEAPKYCFGPNSAMTSAKLTDGDLSALAVEMRDGFQNSAGTGRNAWETAFDSLAWGVPGANGASRVCDDQDELFGSPLTRVLHGVDRKYLYAFWRECFQNRQQLFLIFLRAEPLTVGGMGRGSLAASQLGARGVALVWRDPVPPAKGSADRASRNSIIRYSTWRDQYEKAGPHRTRVLFYYQFK